MSAADRPGDGTAPADAVADVVREAGFVRILARADGDALAASGVLARALATTGRPFQVSVVAGVDERASVVADREDETVVCVGPATGADARLDAGPDPASVAAYRAARELGADPDPVPALAGAFCAGVPPGTGPTAGPLEAAATERRPGVAVPTDDLGDGLAHSTLFSVPFSGDESAVRATLAELALPPDLDEDAHRRVGSLVAIAATDEPATEVAAESVERVLRPHVTPEATFATIGGYADVLDCLATAAPGTGVALSLGHDVRAGALDAWRDHAERAHAALSGATTERHDGVFVARTDDDATVATCARLVAGYRSPEPVALAVADGAAAFASRDDADLGAVARETAAAVDGRADGSPRRGTVTFDCGTNEFLRAARAAL